MARESRGARREQGDVDREQSAGWRDGLPEHPAPQLDARFATVTWPLEPWLVVVLCLGACARSLVGHDFLDGCDLIRDTLDKHRLSRRSTAEWDRFWSANPRHSDIIVCLTTTPSRIDRISDTLSSLMAQSLRPQRIRLHIPDYSIREECFYVVPAELKELRSVDIVHCEDQGPATKLLPALSDLPADQAIVVVDDDMVYPPGMLERLQERADAEPGCVFALSGWTVPDDLLDRPTTLVSNLLQLAPAPVKCSRIKAPRPCDVVQGYSGYLVRPRFFDVEAVGDYSAAPPQARWVDDVWLSAHCTAPKYVLPYRRFPCSYWRNASFYSSTALGPLNRGDGDPRTRSNSIVARHLADRWLLAADESSEPERT